MIEPPTRLSARWLARLAVNASLLVLATLLAASLVLERLPLALIWFGALLVLLVHSWESTRRGSDDAAGGTADRRANLLRGFGLACAVAGVFAAWL